MHTYLQDRLQITDLITGWIHRDLGQWDQLAELFHPDGVIEITWYEGPFTGFIEGSRRMGASDLRTKHLIGVPVVQMKGSRAIVETNAVIVAENVSLGLGCSVHNRFYDLAEKRDGVWKLLKRQSVYDMGGFSFPRGPQPIDADELQCYPREYAPLAYLLEKSGFPLGRVFATRGSEQERSMKQAAQAWLNA
ncbi:nuclear transport factor 2 family protein [Pseudomonas sp. X10]